MKRWLGMLGWLCLAMAAGSAQANPFRTRFVCVPPIAANAYELEFFIRDQGQCAENETYMEVRSGGDGSTLVVPPGDSLTPEEQRDLERYRNFFGGSRPPGAPE